MTPQNGTSGVEAKLKVAEHGKVWVFAEQGGGRLLDVGLELLGAGRELATRLGASLAVVLAGHGVRGLAEELLRFGPDRVYLLDAPVLEAYRGEACASVLANLCREKQPDILLLGATTIGADLASRLAAKLRTGLSADCVRLAVDDEGHLLQVVPAFGGGVMATIVCPDRRPQMATVRPGVVPKPETTGAHGMIESVAVRLSESDVHTKVVEVRINEPKAQPITQADVVVAGGWGVGDREGWRLVERLAGSLGAAVGATRPAVDEGWAGEEQMIGQSGTTVRPSLYIGIGISGMMHHMVGIQDAKIIVAINNSSQAPIFQGCDIGVVGDFREVVPCLVKAIQGRHAAE